MLVFALGILIDKLQEEILTWPEATAEQHLFGSINFHINNGRDTGIEMGHVRGDHLNDLSFPMQIRNNLVILDVFQLIMYFPNQDRLVIGLKMRMIYQQCDKSFQTAISVTLN
jgi:hypothetical protein